MSKEKYVSTELVPDERLERLVTRSMSNNGFDRATLRDINRIAWGIDDEEPVPPPEDDAA